MTRKPILVLDFDGVLHSYTSPWTGADKVLDPPVDGAIAFLEEAVGHFDVQIFSSRNHQTGGIDAMAQWLLDNGLPVYALDKIAFPQVKPPAHVTIDDRCLQFDGTFPDMEALMKFKPWNKP